MRWQLQKAKQCFSELLRRTEQEGAQYVTRHGREVAVVLDIEEYRRLTGRSMDLREYLLSGPKVDELEIRRSAEPARVVEFDE